MTSRAFAPAVFRFRLAEGPHLAAAEGRVSDLLGFSAEDFLFKTVSLADRVHAGDADLRERIFSAGGSEGGKVCLRVRHADGGIRCLEAEFEKSAGELKLMLSLARVAGCPEEGSSALRSILDNTEERSFFKDRNHVFTAASTVLIEKLQRVLRGRELPGLTEYDLLPEQDADRHYMAEKEVLATGIPHQGIYELDRPGAGITWINLRLYPVRDASGQVEGVYGIVRNLTERIRAEERHTSSKDPVTGEMTTPDVGTYILDVRRGLIATSENLDLIFGIDGAYPHDLEGWGRLIHPGDRVNLESYLQEVLANPGRMFTREYRIYRPSDGCLRWVHGIGRIERDHQGDPLALRGTVQDITQRKEMEAALRETKERLQLFIEHAPAALAMFDREMRYLAISERWRQTYDITEPDILGRRHYDVIPDMPPAWRERHRRGLAGEASRSDEDRFDRADGTTLWLRWELLPWRASDGSVGGIILFLEDITEAKRAEERLRLAFTLFEQASEAIVVTDLNGSILRVNEAFTQMLGYAPQDVVGRHVELLKAAGGDHDSIYSLTSREVAEKGRWRGELRQRTRDGRELPVAATITTVRDSEGKPQYYVSMFFDISPMKEQERQLHHVVRHDSLTGLPNRFLLTEHLRQQMAEARRAGRILALAAFDLDDFKGVNEQHGKVAADSLLLNVASRMKRVLRDGDTLGRPGGDEFVVILPDLSDRQSSAPMMERLLGSVAEAQTTGANPISASATAGITFYPQDEDVDADQLLRQAQQALYEAKLTGKNRYHLFDPVRDYSLRGRHGKLQEIQRALGRGEFVLHYQPKVNMATGELVGAEALVRWQHPERGLLAPGAFLQLIEEHELAVAMGEWVIDTALTQIEKWADEGQKIRVSVNVSPFHLQQPSFMERLRLLLGAHPTTDASYLGLEILETSTVQDVEHVSRVIESCRELGIRVAIDDFGSGYSSLAYLKRLPAQVLKIDQTFVCGMLENPDDLAILQGVIGLANAFHRLVVAEGVETVEHGEMLLRLGCVMAQGYGIARPMPPENLLAWYAGWQPDVRWKQVKPVNPMDWPMLVAAVELHAWTRLLEQYLKGESNTTPERDETHCRFGAWVESEKLGPRAGSPRLRALDALHRQAHVLARKAMDLKALGDALQTSRLLRHILDLQGVISLQVTAFLEEAELPAPHGATDAAAAARIAAKLQ